MNERLKALAIKWNVWEDEYDDAETVVGFSLPPDFNTEIPLVIVRKALDHYCELCNTGFKTIGGTKNHKRLKHKNVDK